MDFKKQILTWITLNDEDPKAAYNVTKSIKGRLWCRKKHHTRMVEQKGSHFGCRTYKSRLKGEGMKCVLGNELEEKHCGVIIAERLAQNRIQSSQ